MSVNKKTHAETIADVIAEKRRRADEIERDCAEKMKRGEMVSDCYARELVADIRREADRLDAAHKRERGNSAKLREALIDVVKRLEAYAGCDHHTFHPTATTCDGITSIGKCGKIGTCAAIFKARAALAAPPRNCDVYNSESCRMAYHLHGDGLMTMQAFADWLFAPATEKEGGAK